MRTATKREPKKDHKHDVRLGGLEGLSKYGDSPLDMTSPPSVLRPCLTFLPYLPIQQVVSFAHWQVGGVADFEGQWFDPRFEDLSKRFISSFRDRSGSPIRSSAVIANRVEGLNGVRPSPEESLGLQRALDFAFLDLCPKDQHAENAMMSLLTSDNTELFQWPMDLTDGYVSFTYGGVAVTWDGGYKIEDDLRIQAPVELYVPIATTTPDERVLEAMYEVTSSSVSQPSSHSSRRIATAISWLSKAWKNSKSITEADRIVFLKTGFEALSGESSVWQGALWLRKLHERVLSGETEARLDGLLWSNNETERFNWPDDTGAARSVTDLQYWFKAFGGARNSIIHDGVVPNMIFAKGTAYDGHLFFIGQQLLREAIKVVTTELGYAELWRDQVQVARDHLVDEISKMVGDPKPI